MTQNKVNTPGQAEPGKNAPAAGAKPDRMARLETLPRLRSEAQTLRAMTDMFCSAHHSTAKGELCPDCQAFVDYALKRLACCPYGEEKPVCGSCKIHCYKPAEREIARGIMRWAGPRLLFRHPLMAIGHIADKIRYKAPEKPRNPGARNSGRKPS